MSNHKWGDDPIAAIEKAPGSPLALQLESEVVAGYLIQLRKMLEEDTDVANMVAECDPAQLAKPGIIKAFKLVKPGTQHLLEKAADSLLAELDQQRKAAPSLYLVSCKTGRAVMPISAKDVYTPPDFEGLDGKLHKAKPIVHPGITSNLAIAAHESAKETSIISLAGQELAFSHLSDPERMIESAKQKLSGIVNFGDVQGTWHEIEFGKENAAGMEQAVNPAFHRVELYSSVLARRILALCGRGGQCQIGSIRNLRGAKHRWYSLDVRFQRLDASCTSEKLGES
jgi:hypothetical protein